MKRTPIRRVNPARLKKLREVQYGKHKNKIIKMPCLVWTYGGPGCNGEVVPAHAWHTKGSGGLAKDLLPLCVWHEIEVHNIGRKTFQCKYMIDLESEADRLWSERHG